MSATLCFGLLLLATSSALFFAAFRRQAPTRVGFYFVVCSVVYHGLTEIVQRVSSEYSPLRTITTTREIDNWVLLAGSATLAFTLVYIGTVRGRIPSGDSDVALDTRRIFSVLDWRILTVLCVPLVLAATSSSFRIGNQDVDASSSGSTVVGLAGQFVVLALAVATIGFVQRHPRWLLIPIVVQLAVTSLIASRLDVIAGGVTVLFGVAVCKVRLSPWKVIAGVVVVVLLSMGIDQARVALGRDDLQQASPTQRLVYIVKGVGSALAGQSLAGSTDQQPFGSRIDGNSFPAAVLAAENDGRSPVRLQTLRNDILLAVPSFIDPVKLSSDAESRSEKAYQADHFGVDVKVDFLPTQLGTMLGYFGPYGLIVLAMLLAFVIGSAEIWCRQRASPIRFIVLLTLLACVASYEEPLSVYPLQFRGALALALVIAVLDSLRHRRTDAVAEVEGDADGEPGDDAADLGSVRREPGAARTPW